jgi:hypothetical protein
MCPHWKMLSGRRGIMRGSTTDEHDRFVAFNDQLKKLAESEPLKEIDRKSPQSLQVMSFHLIFEFLIEQWINFKLNKGVSLFSGIEKIGFNNKLYIAKNIGLPKEIFKALDTVNRERNSFAHNIFKKSIARAKIYEIAELADSIQATGGEFNRLGVYIEGRLFYAKNIECENTLLNLALTALKDKIRNYVFIDIHHETSHPI